MDLSEDEEVELLIERVRRTEHGFTDIRRAADELVASHPAAETLQLAYTLSESPVHQARMLATFLFGEVATTFPESLLFLKGRVSQDQNWRVQEILAQAFDHYCATIGYERALPIIGEWLASPVANVRRAVTEGLRVWTERPYFREQPAVAIGYLSRFKDDESEYVRKSVGNALRDISRKHRELVRTELQGWDTSQKRIAQTYKLAHRFLTDEPK
jgi:3-methyladenine DNA glycosylase AlkD